MQVIVVQTVEKNGLSKKAFSYISVDAVAVGDVVRVPFRKGFRDALVVDVASAKDMKAYLRSQSYTLKTVLSVAHRQAVDEAYLASLYYTARFFLVDFHELVADAVAKPAIMMRGLLGDDTSERTEQEDLGKSRKYIVMQAQDERFVTYRQYIRNMFSHGVSVAVLFPTREALMYGLEHIDTHSKDRIAVLTGGLTEKKLQEAYAIMSRGEPFLVLITPAYLSVVAGLVGSIIVEDESSPYYRLDRDVSYDVRVLVRIFTEHTKKAIFFGASMLSLWCRELAKKDRYETYRPLPLQDRSMRRIMYIQKPAPSTMTPSHISELPRSLQAVLFPETYQYIRVALEEKKQIFIYGVRHGYASFLVCQDCGTMVACPSCGASVQLVGDRETFSCGSCGVVEIDTHLCESCSGHSFTDMGIGADKIAETLSLLFPNAPLVYIQNETTKTKYKKLRGESKGPLLVVGTRKALSWDIRVDISVVVSLQTLLFLPRHDATEHTRDVLVRLAERTEGSMLIQDRGGASSLSGILGESVWRKWYTHMADTRMQSEAPPYYVHILLGAFAEKKHATLRSYVQAVGGFMHALGASSRQKIGSHEVRHVVILPAEVWEKQAILSAEDDTIYMLIQLLEEIPVRQVACA